jgi:hypothetical protein
MFLSDKLLGWRDLDPCFANAGADDVFVESDADGTDRIAEVPDDLRHKVTMRLKVERSDMVAGGAVWSGFSYSYPLEHTFNTVELVGRPVTLGHLVQSAYPEAFMIFYYMQHTYTPYFAVGDFETVIEGQPFQDMISSFPFGNFLTTAEWLLFDAA